jgi:DNA helicase-2/ATP-dependent DNA helicase PcrA
VAEIPQSLIESIRTGLQVSSGTNRRGPREDTGGLSLGASVRHSRFGHGTVVSLEGQGPNARIQVNFEEAGSKWLVLAYANLERVA